MPRPTALIILDGWGEREATRGNAVRLAKTPNFTKIWNAYPHTFLHASGLQVGLPDGVMGNSEVGHLNIGAGRVVYQDLTRINEAIRDASFFANPVLLDVCKHARESGATLHLMGLLSTGGVHSHLAHWQALLRATREQHVPRVALHLFTDGRDMPPTSGVALVDALQQDVASTPGAQIASICGRYYAMDRDQRWERTKLAYDLLVHGVGVKTRDPRAALAQSYAEHCTDEFVKPIVCVDESGAPRALMKNDDLVLFVNFRSDRTRQLTQALGCSEFASFDRGATPQLREFVGMTQYHHAYPFRALFAPQSMAKIFGEVVSGAHLTQLRIAETEKYAHVTFFFNGGEDRAFPGEERVLVPSVRDVPTYDMKPQMSAHEIAQEVVTRIRAKAQDVIILNFANPDMVGHTGVLEAAIHAVETVDTCLGDVLNALEQMGGVALVTADHGNCEEMIMSDGSPHTSHTTNLVPCVLVDPTRRNARLRERGALCDLAPTLLALLGVAQPAEMTGTSLIV